MPSGGQNSGHIEKILRLCTIEELQANLRGNDMVTEVRRLLFSHSETTKAIKDYGEKFHMVFPEGKVIRVRFAGTYGHEFHTMKQFKTPLHGTYNIEENVKAVTITFFNESTFEQKFFNLTADFVSGALIEYCIHNQIMMPKQAKKSLDVTDFNVCLDINYENKTEADQGNAGLSLDE
ncbi:MAG: hypothetical protein KBC88_01325 [Alphaproteobacteria bacterium]|nr:hypothetical protein [Alphaproteobacteria bacterium]